MDPKAPLAHCDECPLWNRPLVAGDGPPKTDLVIVGWAPGKTEVEVGKPFVGDSGGVLNEALDDAGIDQESAYITNAVLCHPVKPKPPVPAIRACHDRLVQEIERRGPRKVIASGKSRSGPSLTRREVSWTCDLITHIDLPSWTPTSR